MASEVEVLQACGLRSWVFACRGIVWQLCEIKQTKAGIGIAVVWLVVRRAEEPSRTFAISATFVGSQSK